MRPRPHALRRLPGRLGRAAVAWLASAALLALRLTWRRLSIASAPWPARAVLAFWHGDQLALSVLPRAWVRDTAVLVSRSADGQLGAVWARALGARVVRGSSSSGAVVGALGLRRCLRAAGRIALALDGPRGPRHAAGRSSTRLAAGAACPVVGVVAVPRRALHLRSWDRLAIPLPGTTIVVGWDVLPADDPAGALRRLWERAAAIGRAGDGAQGRRRPRAWALLGCLGWCLGLAAMLGGCDTERARALEVLRSGDTSARVQALRVLAARPDPDLAPRIVPFLADPAGRVRHAALMALGAVGTRGQLSAVIGRLSDRDLEVRLVAVRLLGESGHARAVATLLPLLRDANAIMRQTAAQALQALGRSPWQQRQAESAAHFEAELRRLADPAPQARAEAARELGRSGSVRAAGALQRRLGAARESTAVVGAVLRALVRVDPAAASRAVHELGRAADPARRVVALSVAGRLRPVAWELLGGALVDPQPEVRGEALRGLARLRLAPPAALAAALCAALAREPERSLRLLAAQAVGAQRLGCAQQARALEARAREALGVAEPSAELARTLVDSFDLLARLRRAGDSALLIGLLQRAAIVRQWEAEPWISAERWRAGDSPSVALVATRGAATRPEAPPKDPGQALRWLLARFPVRESDSREQPLLPPTGSVGDLAGRLVWLPPTAETRLWLAQVARDAADEELAAAALDRLAEGAPPRSLSGIVASGPTARRGEHRSGTYGLVREHRSTAATQWSGGAAISRQAPSPDARGPAASALPASVLQQAVETGLASSEPLRRRAATGACVALPPPLGEVRALALIKDPDVAVREAAALVLGRLRVRQALPALLALLAREPSPALVQALALLGDRRATGPLLRMLDEDHVGPRLGERLVVVQALGELADPAAAPALERELAHADGRLRRAAARALARAGRTRSIEALRVCAADYYAAVRQACAAAGERLTAARRAAP